MGGREPVEIYDISPLALVRRRLGRAAFVLNATGFLILMSTIDYWIMKGSFDKNNLALFIVLFCGLILLAKHLKAGNSIALMITILLGITLCDYLSF
jgi:hypothetical protein